MPFLPFERTHPYLEKTELVLVPGGTFMMGSNDPEAFDDEKEIHEVTLQSFVIGKYLVTQELWETIMGKDNNHSKFKGKHHPVEQVSWEDIKLFLDQLNQDKRLIPGQKFRLPSEAEWEFAAKGGKHFPKWKYSGSDKLEEVGWYDENSHGETKQVGLKTPNELGIYDMSGNVREWCADQWHNSYMGAPKNNTAWVDRSNEDTHRIYRGGSWNFNGQHCRVTSRYASYPLLKRHSIGFRVVLFPPPVSWSTHQ